MPTPSSPAVLCSQGPNDRHRLAVPWHAGAGRTAPLGRHDALSVFTPRATARRSFWSRVRRRRWLAARAAPPRHAAFSRRSRGSIGRPMSNPHTLAIDIGGTGLKAAVLDAAQGHMLDKRVRVRTPGDPTPEVVIEALVHLDRELAGSSTASRRLPGRGAARHGADRALPSHQRNGRASRCRVPLSERLGKPGENDARKDSACDPGGARGRGDDLGTHATSATAAWRRISSWRTIRASR